MDVDLEAHKREARAREIGELARGDLGDLIEQAVREGLRDAGLKGMLAPYAASVTNAVVKALKDSEPETVDEVADAIERDGGFMRVGQDKAIINGRFVTSGMLISALSVLRRRDAEAAST